MKSNGAGKKQKDDEKKWIQKALSTRTPSPAPEESKHDRVLKAVKTWLEEYDTRNEEEKEYRSERLVGVKFSDFFKMMEEVGGHELHWFFRKRLLRDACLLWKTFDYYFNVKKTEKSESWYQLYVDGSKLDGKWTLKMGVLRVENEGCCSGSIALSSPEAIGCIVDFLTHLDTEEHGEELKEDNLHPWNEQIGASRYCNIYVGKRAL